MRVLAAVNLHGNALLDSLQFLAIFGRLRILLLDHGQSLTMRGRLEYLFLIGGQTLAALRFLVDKMIHHLIFLSGWDMNLLQSFSCAEISNSALEPVEVFNCFLNYRLRLLGRLLLPLH